MAVIPVPTIIFLKFKRIQSSYKVHHHHRNNQKLKKSNFQDNLKSHIKIQAFFLISLSLFPAKSKVLKRHLN